MDAETQRDTIKAIIGILAVIVVAYGIHWVLLGRPLFF